MENKRKHLEFLQTVITRMNTNSFLVKGWTVTLVSALFALAAKDANAKFILISYIVVPAFWILDGFFISTERGYRDLYDEVAKKAEEEIDFNMTRPAPSRFDRTWLGGIFSETLWLFYGILILTIILVRYLI